MRMRHLTKPLMLGLAFSLFSANFILAMDPPTERANTPPLPKAQSSCPVMGGMIGPKDKALHVDIKGKRIYICCAACEGAVLADPDKYIKKIEQRGETVEEAPQPAK
ncbi:MAG: hypothetical protein PHI06_07880 [Desulfobulbaceae bacterium]|nr:hypothetical protein [Desulfobulbaceae bacterium]